MAEASSSPVEGMIEEVLGPLLKADGGKVFVVECSAETVSLHLTGRFSGCPGNTLIARRVIEPAVHAVAPGARVTVTSGAIIPAGARLL